MKTGILCGGFGVRLSEETVNLPKPLVEVGDNPILWHIMRIYAHFGFDDFVLALGYKGEMIKRYFMDYYPLSGDLTVSLGSGEAQIERRPAIDWRVQMLDTGGESMTGGRVRRMGEALAGEGTFMLTYGDGVADVDIEKLLAFHRAHGKLATVTAVRPPARFGALALDGDLVAEFQEKPQVREGWINGGFFVFEPAVLDYIEGDHIELERAPLERLAGDGQLMAYRHEGFWHSMDTLRDKHVLEQLWASPDCPWRVWDA
jgi:glucose-1-phosphate cytidylyltransferase